MSKILPFIWENKNRKTLKKSNERGLAALNYKDLITDDISTKKLKDRIESP